MKKPVFLKGRASWVSELPSVFNYFFKTNLHSIKICPFQVSVKKSEKTI